MLNRMQKELNQFLGNGHDFFPALFEDNQSLLGSEWSPRIDIKEEDSNYVVTADIPGVEPKDIQVTMDNGVLNIRGERKSEKEEKKKNYHRKECFTGSFERSFRMPESADSDRISAKGKNGVLTVLIGKKESSKPRPIKIEADK
jgi:HSP20 family protein